MVTADNELIENPFVGDEEEGEPDSLPTPPRSQKKGAYMCRYCPVGPFTTTSRRSRHERNEHGDKKQREEQSSDLNKKTGGLDFSILSEKAKEFVEALDSAVDSTFKASTRKQVIKAYQEGADVLSKDAKALEDFLDDYGFNLHQIRQIRRTIIGGRSSSPAGGATSTVMAYDPRTGAGVPVIILNQQPAQSRDRETPLIITAPGNTPMLQSPDKGVTADEVAEIVEGMLDRFFKRQDEERKSQAASEAQVSATTRRYQEPVLTADGHPIMGTDGQPIMRWVIEPIDPLSNTLRLLTNNGLLGSRAEAKGLTAEEVRSIVRESAPKPVDPAFQELRDGFKDLKTAVETKEKIETGVKAATESLMENLKPQLEELRDFKTRGNLSDTQAEIGYHERLSGSLIGSMDKFREGVREDLQPLVIQVAAANMKHLGLSEQTIADVLRKPQPPASPTQNTVAERRKAAQVMKQWVEA